MSLSFRDLILGGVSALAFASPALAVEPVDGRDLQTVIVTAKKDPNDPAVVAEARARLSETPGGVAVVANETYADRYALTLGDTLGQVAGVFAQKKFGEDSRFAVRGSGIGNNMHNRGSWLAIDGVPINLADGSGDFQELDPLTARYIEVYKGGNALRFGGAQLGGAVNFVTPTGHNAGFNQKLRIEGGSFKTLRLHGAVAGVVGNTDYYAALTHTRADGCRQHSDQRAKRLTLSIGQTFGEGRDLRLILQVNDIDQEIPGSLTLAQALNSPKQTTDALTVLRNTSREVKSVRATLQGHWALNDDWRLTGGLYATGKELDHPVSIFIDQDYQNYGAFARLDGEFTVGNQRGDLFAGVNLRRGQTGAKTFANANSARGMMIGRAQQNAEAVDLFGEARLFLTDDVAFIAGGTYGWTRRDYVNQLNRANNTQKTFDWFAPRLGLLWENAAGTQVFANLTRSLEAPTYGALVQGAVPNFVPVEPQDAWTAEIGTRGRLDGLIWDLTLYRAEIRKEMLSYIVSPDIPASTFNANKTVHQG
ncbi:MAG: TonB-dependent receptor family protein, partial [Asticcacaulis sp.]